MEIEENGGPNDKETCEDQFMSFVNCMVELSLYLFSLMVELYGGEYSWRMLGAL